MLTIEDLLEIRKDYLAQTETLENPDNTITGTTIGLLLVSKPLRQRLGALEEKAQGSADQDILAILDPALRIAIEIDKRDPNLDRAARVAMTRLEKILCPNLSELEMSITSLEEAVTKIEKHSYLIQNPNSVRQIVKAIHYANEATDQELLEKSQFQFKLKDEPLCTHVFVFHTEFYIDGGIKKIRDTLVRLKLEIIAAWNDAVKRNELSQFLNDFSETALCIEGATSQALNNAAHRSEGNVVPGIVLLPDNFTEIFSVCYRQATNFLAAAEMNITHCAIEKIILKAHAGKQCYTTKPNDIKHITSEAIIKALNEVLSDESYFFVDEKAKVADMFKGFPLLMQYRLARTFQQGYLGAEMAQEMKDYADDVIQLIRATKYSNTQQAFQFAKILKDTDNFCTPLRNKTAFAQAVAIFFADAGVSRILCDLAGFLLINRKEEIGVNILKLYLGHAKLWPYFAILLEKALDNRDTIVQQIPEELWRENAAVLNIIANKPVLLEQLIKTKPELFWELLYKIIDSASLVFGLCSFPKGIIILRQLLDKYPPLVDLFCQSHFLLKNYMEKDKVALLLTLLNSRLTDLEGTVLHQKLVAHPLLKQYQAYTAMMIEEKENTVRNPIQNKISTLLGFLQKVDGKDPERNKSIINCIILSAMNDSLVNVKQLLNQLPAILREQMQLKEEDSRFIQAALQETLSHYVAEQEYRTLCAFFETQIFSLKNNDSARQTLAKMRTLPQLMFLRFMMNEETFFSLMQTNRSMVSLLPIPALLSKSSGHKMSIMEAMVDAKIQKTNGYNEQNDANDLILFFELIPQLALALPKEFWSAEVMHERKKLPRLAWIVARLKPLFNFMANQHQTLFENIPQSIWQPLLIDLAISQQAKVAELVQWKPDIVAFELFMDPRFVIAFSLTSALLDYYPMTKWYEKIGNTGNNTLYYLSLGQGAAILEGLIEKFPAMVTDESVEWLMATSQTYPNPHQSPLFTHLLAYFQNNNNVVYRTTELFRKYPQLFIRLPQTVWHQPLTQKGYEGLTPFYLFLLPDENVIFFNQYLAEHPEIATNVTREVLCREVHYPDCLHSSVLHLLSSSDNRIKTMDMFIKFNPDAFRSSDNFDYETPWRRKGKLPFLKKRATSLTLLNEYDLGIKSLITILNLCPLIATQCLMADSDLFDLAFHEQYDLLEKIISLNPDFCHPETARVLLDDEEHQGDTMFYYMCRLKEGRVLLKKIIEAKENCIKHIPSKIFYQKNTTYKESVFQLLCESVDGLQFALFLLKTYPSLVKRITPEILIPKLEQFTPSQSSFESANVDSNTTTEPEIEDAVILLDELKNNKEFGWEILKLFAQNENVRPIIPRNLLEHFHIEIPINIQQEEEKHHPVTQYVMQRSQHVINCLTRLTAVRNNVGEEAKNSEIRSKVLAVFRDIVNNYGNVDELRELKQAISATDFNADSIITLMKEETVAAETLFNKRQKITDSPSSGSSAFQKMLMIIDAKMQALQSPERVRVSAKRSFSDMGKSS